MATFKSIKAFDQALAQIEREYQQDAKATGVEMAEVGRDAAYKVARSDLGGDIRFSGWRPELELRVRPKQFGAALIPTRQSAGPWTVAEIGRNKGNASGFQGPGINRRTGMTSRTKAGRVRKVRAVRARRWNGYTEGKQTASKAFDAIEKATEDIPNERLRKTMKRRLDVN